MALPLFYARSMNRLLIYIHSCLICTKTKWINRTKPESGVAKIIKKKLIYQCFNIFGDSQPKHYIAKDNKSLIKWQIRLMDI